MLSKTLRAGSAFALIVASAGLASAQTVPPAPGTNPPANDPNGFRAKAVLGASLQLQGGTPAGTVDDIVLSHEGVIEYLIVNNGGKLVTVPWEAARFNWGGAAAVGTVNAAPAVVATLNITPQQYQAIPTYTAATLPRFYAPTYRTDVYRWYGLTPGQTRRIERNLERR